ncbi:hypothetical protein XBFM1_60014 [Xenorhabdus bovienii str. feltiae Moldova]|uniref:Uncharacterized protein n=1 Tax=Xenorhabdus bovienii str. feltiae Moldova TaxID=1398200 RepID=A0A077NWE8_XENBV|nr:hypothetical protein XBFM1_60014 [Xenorhabdus bovienii str. feltiae Moldova]
MDIVILRKIKNGSSLWSHFFIIHSIKNLPVSFHSLSDFNKLRSLSFRVVDFYGEHSDYEILANFWC